MARTKGRRHRKKKVNTSSEIRKIINSQVETKVKAYEYKSVAIPDLSGTLIDEQLFKISQGAGASARQGRKINIKSIVGMFHLTFPDTTNLVRVVLYRAKDETATLSGVGTDVDDYIDRNKFVVFYDQYHSGGTAGGPASKQFYINQYYAGGGKQVEYGSSTNSDVVKNDMRLFMISDSALASDPNLTGNIAVYYKDA